MSRARTVKGFRRNLAFFVAIDHYANGVPPLQTPVADATALAKLLHHDHGFETEIIANEEATLAKLQEFFTGLAMRVGQDDRVFFYFAGHGVALDSDEGPRGYLLPQDADRANTDRFLPMVAMHDALSALPCRHMLAVLDCCFAGAFRWSSARNLSVIPLNLHHEHYAWFVRDPAWQVIASAAHDQKALDIAAGEPLGARDGAPGHSPFARALLEGLSGAADRRPSNGEGDGVITATELYLHLRDRLQPDRFGGRLNQTPSLWPLRKHDKGEFVFLAPGAAVNLPLAPPLDPESNPWRGLQPYDRKHSDLFFGRRRAAEELAQRVATEALIVVVGPSGIGKSSLVRAGLLPRLEANVIPIVVRPGPEPFASLAAALNACRQNGGNVLTQASLRDDAHGLAAWVKADASQTPGEFLLVIDQLEELITMNNDIRVADTYMRLIAAGLRETADNLRVVVTIRSEFESQFVNSALKDRWYAARYAVPQMNQDELRRVIVEPAAARVMRFESEALVDQLVNEVVAMPGALPLLSFALSQMYSSYLQRKPTDRTITSLDFAALQGGVAGSLRVRANQLIGQMGELHRASARRVLERLVSLETGQFARRRVRRREFVSLASHENERVEYVLERLDEARLIVTDEVSSEPYLEVAHDALILGWDLLLFWVREDAPRIAELRRLTSDADEWRRSSRKNADLLWSETTQLATIAHLRSKAFPGLNEEESHFADASRRRARQRLAFRVVASAALLVTIGLAVYGFFASEQARHLAAYRRYAADMASADRAWSSAGDVDQTRAILSRYTDKPASEDPRSFEWYAFSRMATAERVEYRNLTKRATGSAVARATPVAAVAMEGEPVRVLDMRDGRVIARGSESTAGSRALEFAKGDTILIVGGVSELRLQSVAGPDETVIRIPGSRTIRKLAVHPNGMEVLLIDESGKLFSVDLETKLAHERLQLTQEAGRYAPQYMVTYTEDAETVVVATVEGKVRLLDPKTLRERKSIVVEGLRFEGTWLATSNLVLMPVNDRVRILDTKSGLLIDTQHLGENVSTVGDCRHVGLLAVGGSWRGIELWQATELRNPTAWRYSGVLRGFRGWPSNARCVPGTSLLVATTLAGDFKVWDVARIGRSSFAAHPFDVLAAHSLSGSGDIVSADAKGNVRRWDIKSGNVRWSAQVEDDTKGMVLASALGQVAVAGWSGILTMINIADGKVVQRRPGYAPLATSSDGSVLAWVGADNTSIEASTRGSNPVRVNLYDTWKNPKGDFDITALAVSSKGDTIAAGTADGTLFLVDRPRAKILTSRKVADRIIWSLAFSPDGRTLAVGGSDNLVQVLGAADASDIAALSGHWGAVQTLAFTANGRTLASGGRDGVIRFWNTAAWQEMISLAAHQADNDPGVKTLAFGADSDVLISAGARGRVIVWEADPDKALVRLAGKVAPARSAK